MDEKPYKDKLFVEIFGRKYALRGQADQDYLNELASFVDAKMNEVSKHSEGSAFSKLAVLSAINISHELFQLKNRLKKEEELADGKARGIIESIEALYTEKPSKSSG